MILGLDINLNTIGVSFIDDKNNNELKYLAYIKLNKEKNYFSKILKFKEELEKIPLVPDKIGIEEPLVMFKSGFSSAQILSKLSMFNGMCAIMVCLMYSVIPRYYNVATARKMAYPDLKFPSGSDRKHLVWEKVSLSYPDIRWYYGPRSGKLIDECYDMSDSLVISLAYSKDKQ